MAGGGLNLADTQSVEYAVVTFLEKVEAIRRDCSSSPPTTRPSMQVELRSLEFWRATISECLATFFFVFVVSGAGAMHSNGAVLVTALASGFVMATLYQCFGHISGAHANPAVTTAMAFSRRISPIRGAIFIVAQCGGGIAGAALLYGVTVPGYPSPAAPTPSAWERLGVEFILSFLLVLTYCGATDAHRKTLGGAASSIGAAYLACSLVSMPMLNPARALGPSFVMNKWESHWVYWVGPLFGGGIAGLVYEYIFSPRRHSRRPSDSIDGDSSSIHSEDDPYDDLDKNPGKLHHPLRSVQPGGEVYHAVRGLGSPAGATSYCPSLTSASLYSSPPCKLDRVESLYGGTKSLYAKSPPLTRANLNRSQSVYAKAPVGSVLPRPGPLVPAQSLYPMRLGPTPVIAPHCIANQQHQKRPQQQVQQPPPQQQSTQQNLQQHQTVQHNVGEVLSSATHSATTTVNQNVQNQQNAARRENVYGVRGSGGVYGLTSQHHSTIHSQPPPPPPPQSAAPAPVSAHPAPAPAPAPSPGGSSSAASTSNGKHDRRPDPIYGSNARRPDSGAATRQQQYAQNLMAGLAGYGTVGMSHSSHGLTPQMHMGHTTHPHSLYGIPSSVHY